MKSYLRLLILSVLFPLAALAAADTPPALPQTFTLGTVVQLQRQGMTDQDIALIIKNAPNIPVAFDTSAQGLVTMKQIGFSDQLIAAILERSISNGNAPTPTNSGSSLASAAAVPTVFQNGKNLMLRPGAVAITFAQGNDSLGALKELGVGVAVYTGVGVAAGAAGSAAGVMIPLAPIGVNAWNALRGKKIKGFSYELLPQNASTNVVTANTPIEFAIPLSTFADGRYPHAAPVLITLEVSAETQTRVAGIARAEIKSSVTKGPGEPKLSEAYQRKLVVADLVVTDSAATIKTSGLARGEYAVGFVYDGKLLPSIIDFSVR